MGQIAAEWDVMMATKERSVDMGFNGWASLPLALDLLWEGCAQRRSVTISAKPLVRDTARYWLKVGRGSLDIAGCGSAFSTVVRGEFLDSLIGILNTLRQMDCPNGTFRIAFERAAGTFRFNFRQLVFHFDVGSTNNGDGWSVSRHYSVLGQSY